MFGKNNMTPRWLLASFFHPVFSIILLILGTVLPSGGTFGAISYIASMLSFLINLPGVFLINGIYNSSASDSSKYFVFLAMIAITYGLVVLPICFLISRCSKRKNPEQGAEAND